MHVLARGRAQTTRRGACLQHETSILGAVAILSPRRTGHISVFACQGASAARVRTEQRQILAVCTAALTILCPASARIRFIIAEARSRNHCHRRSEEHEHFGRRPLAARSRHLCVPARLASSSVIFCRAASRGLVGGGVPARA